MVVLLLSTTGFDPFKVALVVADLEDPLKLPNKPVVSLLLSSFLLSPSQKGLSASLTGAAGFKGSVEKADVEFALVRVVVCVMSIGLDSTDDVAKKLGIAGLESDVAAAFFAGSADSELDGPEIETEAGGKAELPPSSAVDGSILFEDKSEADGLGSRGTTVFEKEKGNEVIGGSFAPVRSCSMGFVLQKSEQRRIEDKKTRTYFLGEAKTGWYVEHRSISSRFFQYLLLFQSILIISTHSIISVVLKDSRKLGLRRSRNRAINMISGRLGATYTK